MWRQGVCIKWGGDQSSRDTHELHRCSASWREEGLKGKRAQIVLTHTLSLSLCGVNRIFLSSIATWWMHPGYIERRYRVY
jgi:hypothetical protein